MKQFKNIEKKLMRNIIYRKTVWVHMHCCPYRLLCMSGLPPHEHKVWIMKYHLQKSILIFRYCFEGDENSLEEISRECEKRRWKSNISRVIIVNRERITSHSLYLLYFILIEQITAYINKVSFLALSSQSRFSALFVLYSTFIGSGRVRHDFN